MFMYMLQITWNGLCNKVCTIILYYMMSEDYDDIFVLNIFVFETGDICVRQTMNT